MNAAAPLATAADPAPAAGGLAPAARCDNCGAAVTGRYCSACGQRRELPVHSLWHFSRIAAEDLTHADSRLWRTLAALLFKPGYLTAEFLAGRRARYLPPVRLYLVLSVVFFLWASATQPKLTVITVDTDHGVHSTELAASGAAGTPFAAQAGESAQQRAERLCHDATYQGPWQARLAPLVPPVCRKVMEDNGRSLRESFLHNAPRAMFLFLPLLAGAMMLMYWRPRHYYVEHLLLFVHNHAFAFLVPILVWAIATVLPPLAPWIRFAVGLYIPWYLYRSMRVVYRQGRALTFAKFLGLSFFYLIAGALMLAATSVYSVLTL